MPVIALNPLRQRTCPLDYYYTSDLLDALPGLLQHTSASTSCITPEN